MLVCESRLMQLGPSGEAVIEVIVFGVCFDQASIARK